MYDYELEKHYHPENFDIDFDDDDEIEEASTEEKLLKYNMEVNRAILEGIKL